MPESAMILAAGLGLRMRPLTETMPKPLVKVAGQPLIAHNLSALGQAGIGRVVVNTHHLSEQIRAFASRWIKPPITVSDETDRLLDSGGGIKKALPLLGTAPFFVLNADSFWIDGPRSNLARLAEAWRPETMDILLLLASHIQATGYDAQGDFMMDPDGRLIRRSERQVAPFIYAGVALMKPALFDDMPDGPFSLNRLFDRAIAAGRLFGLRLDGWWLHVGTPDAIAAAEDRIARSIL
jgi:MurNAc alpha-1-phosphate uridylyltransferase